MNQYVRDLDIAAPNAADNRRLEVVADGLPLFHGAQLVDILWPFRATLAIFYFGQFYSGQLPQSALCFVLLWPVLFWSI